MNPTNESIGRAFRELLSEPMPKYARIEYVLNRARELDRQAPGEWGGYEAFEQFLAAEIDSAPEALRRLGEWLGLILDEDHFATANRLVLGAMLETSDAIRKVAASKAAPQPAAQEQGEVGEHVLILEMILTSYGDKPLTFTSEKAALKAAITCLTRAAGAEDARRERLISATRAALPYVATQVIGCHGEKCRESWCHSCWGDEAAEQAAANASAAYNEAHAALAAIASQAQEGE